MSTCYQKIKQKVGLGTVTINYAMTTTTQWLFIQMTWASQYKENINLNPVFVAIIQQLTMELIVKICRSSLIVLSLVVVLFSHDRANENFFLD